ncbi:MAG: CHAT domain-containing protein, partial [Thermoanaerobaculia bacterium]|nr:CHAT domain-containing protein [Thermoanaerobaculia bacterium]
ELPGAVRRQLDALQEARARLEIQQYQATAAGAAYDALDALLFEKHLAWKNLLRPYLGNKPEGLTRPPVTDLPRLRGSLLPDQALLEYFVGDSNLYVVALTKDMLRLIPLEYSGELENTVETLRKTLTGSGDTIQFSSQATLLFGRSAAQLYDWLLAKPLEALPKPVNKLIIVPDGILGYLPFEVLGAPGAQISGAFRSFPYLIRNYTVAYAFSGKSLLVQNKLVAGANPARATFGGFSAQYGGAQGGGRRQAASRALLFRDALPNLPGAAREVKDIAQLLDGDVYIDSAATKAQFKSRAGQFRILHFAMHALLDDQDPRFSKLLFTKSGDGTEDDDLYAVELHGMRLPAEMAVLSACQTGVGVLHRGEGVMSLSKAFSVAGVPATVMSLWSVDDTETATLMTNFYKSLAMGLPKDEALRQAKLKYLSTAQNTRASPYFWAGFIAAGDMTPLFAR